MKKNATPFDHAAISKQASLTAPAQIPPSKQGQRAELTAQRFLVHHGLQIICCNFSCKLGEIDIIAQDKQTLVFVEVRYRKHHSFGSGAATVTQKKQKRIINTAALYLQKRQLNVACRFDVIELQAKTYAQTELDEASSSQRDRRNIPHWLSSLRSAIRYNNETHSSEAHFYDPHFRLHWIKSAFT